MTHWECVCGNMKFLEALWRMTDFIGCAVPPTLDYQYKWHKFCFLIPEQIHACIGFSENISGGQGVIMRKGGGPSAKVIFILSRIISFSTKTLSRPTVRLFGWMDAFRKMNHNCISSLTYIQQIIIKTVFSKPGQYLICTAQLGRNVNSFKTILWSPDVREDYVHSTARTWLWRVAYFKVATSRRIKHDEQTLVINRVGTRDCDGPSYWYYLQMIVLSTVVNASSSHTFLVILNCYILCNLPMCKMLKKNNEQFFFTINLMNYKIYLSKVSWVLQKDFIRKSSVCDLTQNGN